VIFRSIEEAAGRFGPCVLTIATSTVSTPAIGAFCAASSRWRANAAGNPPR